MISFIVKLKESEIEVRDGDYYEETLILKKDELNDYMKKINSYVMNEYKMIPNEDYEVYIKVDLKKDFIFYQDYLQLHQEYTFHKFNNNFIDELVRSGELSDERLDEFIKEQLITTWLESFDEDNEVETLQLGRSGRHICVEDTRINRLNYKTLVEQALKCEKELVDYYNNLDREELEKYGVI